VCGITFVRNEAGKVSKLVFPENWYSSKSDHAPTSPKKGMDPPLSFLLVEKMQENLLKEEVCLMEAVRKLRQLGLQGLNPKEFFYEALVLTGTVMNASNGVLLRKRQQDQGTYQMVAGFGRHIGVNQLLKSPQGRLLETVLEVGEPVVLDKLSRAEEAALPDLKKYFDKNALLYPVSNDSDNTMLLLLCETTAIGPDQYGFLEAAVSLFARKLMALH